MNQNFSLGIIIRNSIIAFGLGVIGSITVFFPLFKYISMILWMAPIVIIARKQGYINAVLTVIISGVFMTVLNRVLGVPEGEVISTLVTGTFGVLALIYAYCFTKEKSPLQTILIGVLFLSFIQMSSIALVLITSDVNVDKSINDYSRQVLEQKENQEALDLLENEGYSKRDLINAFESFMRFINLTLPALLVIDAIITALLTYMGLYYIQKRSNLKVLKELGFSRWRIPWYCVWVFIIGLSLALMGDSFSFPYNKYMAMLGYNLVLALVPILTVIGLAIMTYLFSQVQGLIGIKILIVIMVVFNLPVIIIIMALMGAFDPFIDIRRHIQRLHRKA